MRRFPVVALLACAAIAGCGDDRSQIGDLMGQLRQVQDSGDAETACEKVYVVRERARPGREEEGGEEQDGGEEGESGACREAFERARELRRADLKSLATK